ncbi:MAG: ABC transporter permease, partial [Alphaproteobacteria bacterium]|nr:ABC transporter permease [Alphaproteobacteria bacterium]
MIAATYRKLSALLPKEDTPFKQAMDSFATSKTSLVALFVVCLFILFAIFAPWIAPHDPNDANLFRRLQPPFWLEGGDFSYLLGCDAQGRDILSRIIYGSRVSILIGAAVIFIATLAGIFLGLLAGYKGGITDKLISRVVDILLGFPYLIFAIALVAMTGPGMDNIILALAYKEWVIPCRVVRAETLAAKNSEYVEAARSVGVSSRYIMWREILPNILSPVIVVSTVRM